ncbi:uncharacterized protein LOC126980288 [Eriocheir sinensis]|uniref:uncharacterized protein LOC126980288 n=1 Tax=Eriocheir sinensis TaxID=95602 RepID=UPI0021C72C9C|nr:uncharacterized protein LOC126980288 [Eriocheir sinensis]
MKRREERVGERNTRGRGREGKKNSPKEENKMLALQRLTTTKKREGTSRLGWTCAEVWEVQVRVNDNCPTADSDGSVQGFSIQAAVQVLGLGAAEQVQDFTIQAAAVQVVGCRTRRIFIV